MTPTLLAESTSERRLIGRLDAGSDIIEGLAELCDTQEIFAGEIRALGVLKTIEISELDPETGRYRVLAKIAGPITLVHAYGNIAELGGSPVVALRGVFSWNEDGTQHSAAGHLVRGEVVHCEFVIEIFDDITITRGMDATTGIPIFQSLGAADDDSSPRADAPDPPPSKPPKPPKPPLDAVPVQTTRGATPPPMEAPPPLPSKRSTGWDDVLSLSKTLDDEGGEEWLDADDVDLKKTDVLMHQIFGESRILRVEDGERLVIRDDKGKPRTIAMSHLELQETPEVLRGKGTVYKARVKRR